MWELDHNEGWVLKNWCFTSEVLEKTLESLLDCKESKPVNPKGNQPWIFIGRTSAEAEAQLLWPHDEPTHWKRSSRWERLKAGRKAGSRKRDGSIASLTQSTWVCANWEIVRDREARHAAIHGTAKSQIRLSKRTATTKGYRSIYKNYYTSIY